MKIAHCLTLIHCFCFLVSKFACCRFCKGPASNSKISSKQRFYLIKLVFYSISRQNEPLFWANSTNIPFLRNCSPIITFARYFKNPSRCIKELEKEEKRSFWGWILREPAPNICQSIYECIWVERGSAMPCLSIYLTKDNTLFSLQQAPSIKCVWPYFSVTNLFFNQDIFNAKTIFLSELKTELETIIKKRDLKVGGSCFIEFQNAFWS